MIKKRKIKKNCENYKRIPIEKDDELKSNGSNNKKTPEQYDQITKLKTSKNLKLLQHIRLKKKGINANDLCYETKVLEKNENEKKLLEKQFTKNITEKEIEEAHIEAFIRNNMKEIYEQLDKNKTIFEENYELKNTEENTNKCNEHSGSLEKELSLNEDDVIENLYKISDHLKVENAVNNNQEKLQCITGITEVPIPIEIKLKSIEETEKIKRKLLKQSKLMNMKKKKRFIK
ncbi:conserved protein, unknown function [Hepatocystis sp. ex Piliocolobus tephrosceles]|nr:conserved protein, unknown function [Hepatocystis sp. ex Piliocolobus tephrosceles]